MKVWEVGVGSDERVLCGGCWIDVFVECYVRIGRGCEVIWYLCLIMVGVMVV